MSLHVIKYGDVDIERIFMLLAHTVFLKVIVPLNPQLAISHEAPFECRIAGDAVGGGTRSTLLQPDIRVPQTHQFNSQWDGQPRIRTRSCLSGVAKRQSAAQRAVSIVCAAFSVEAGKWERACADKC
jgi:hypothetical protein